MDKALCCALLVMAIVAVGEGACTIPSNIHGSWDVMNAARTAAEFTVTITSSSLSGITFWNKNLTYDCYLQSGNYYVFVSELTSLFDLYNVNIYFCWYLEPHTTDSYRVFELAGKVLNSVEERATASLSTTSPTLSDVCSVPYTASLAYKQMQVPFEP